MCVPILPQAPRFSTLPGLGGRQGRKSRRPPGGGQGGGRGRGRAGGGGGGGGAMGTAIEEEEAAGRWEPRLGQ
ncbi:hypothetical protein M758_1G206500 [Ceratodon purpureus]|nr:hypothetical protein M758_1G206500 [Ceratodon purpureus]